MKIQEEFTTFTVALIPVAMAMNIAVGQLVALLKLPVYLDCIGTVLVGLACGPFAGALTGGLSNMAWGLFSPSALPFFPVAIWIGLTAGICGRLGLADTWWKAGLTGLVIALTTPFIATPIVVYVYGGVEGSGASLITAVLVKSGVKITSAAFYKNLMVEPLDKVPTALVAFALIQALPKRIMARLPLFAAKQQCLSPAAMPPKELQNRA